VRRNRFASLLTRCGKDRHMMTGQTRTPGKADGETVIVRTTSAYDCGGKCPLRLHVRDGRIVRVEGDDAAPEEQLRACLRCRAYRQDVHNPHRLTHPLKRVGPKGGGAFTRISWDEALDTMAQ
jgi:anaerobic dimethyl sulfoxide reductase subunit A